MDDPLHHHGGGGPAGADWVFGYGSILHDFEPGSPAARLAALDPAAGYGRAWCFRSATGFTAVGLQRRRQPQQPQQRRRRHPVVGILFRIVPEHAAAEDASYIAASVTSLRALDERERGYRRVQLSAEYFSPPATTAAAAAAAAGTGANWPHPTRDRVWAYVPTPAFAHAPSKDYPICQTYVDTVLCGCLKWGGARLAEDWVRSTAGWSQFWLNDAPMSRRPWLHRKRYTEVDRCLEACSDVTSLEDRCHPEEYAARWLGALASGGFWGVPPRNPNFIGRESELAQISEALRRSEAASCPSERVGVTMIETVGLGGVGKTQVAVEYCYRHAASKDAGSASTSSVAPSPPSSPSASAGAGTAAGAATTAAAAASAYGLVMWLRAETAEVLASDFRRFAADAGIPTRGVRNADVVAEVLSRLYQSEAAWLMVLDNVSSREAIEPYLPRGGNAGGHVLVTSREFLDGFSPEHRVELRCFEARESLDLLRRAGGIHLGIDAPFADAAPAAGQTDRPSAGQVLASKLGHLPLALSVAAAYMRQCDVCCGDYVRKLASGVGRGAGSSAVRLPGYPLGVEESLMLSLRRISQQGGVGDTAMAPPRAVLDTLCFLYPDDISKSVVGAVVDCLLRGARTAEEEEEEEEEDVSDQALPSPPPALPVQLGLPWALPLAVLAGGGVGLYLAFAHGGSRTKQWAGALLLASASVAAAGLGLGAAARDPLEAVTREHPARLPGAAGGRCWHPLEERAANTRGRSDGSNGAGEPSAAGMAHQAYDAEVDEVDPAASSVAVVESRTDMLWVQLKGYSLLTVQQGHASMHRLLQQLLRSRLTGEGEKTATSLATAVWAIASLWGFDPADASTWRGAGEVVDHMQTVGAHVLEFVKRCRRERALRAKRRPRQKRTTGVQNYARWWSLAVELQVRAGALLTEGALYMSMALSRFKEAASVLDVALQIQRVDLLEFAGAVTAADGGGSAAARDADADDRGHPRYFDLALRLRSGLAQTMHTAGKVSRYCGNYDEAHTFLQEALELQRAAADIGAEGGGPGAGDSHAVAASMHELGVLHIKRAAWDMASELLQASLAMKRRLHTSARGVDRRNGLPAVVGRRPPSPALRFSEEAATLHQLAVVAMSSKVSVCGLGFFGPFLFRRVSDDCTHSLFVLVRVVPAASPSRCRGAAPGRAGGHGRHRAVQQRRSGGDVAKAGASSGAPRAA